MPGGGARPRDDSDNATWGAAGTGSREARGHGRFLYTYSPDGALESKTDTGTNETTFYRYDLDSNLLGVTLPSGDEIAYVLDASGRRIGRQLNGAFTHRWVYGTDAGPAAEVDAGGQVTTRFVYGARSWVPAYMVRGGVTYALVTDAVGSVRLVVDSSTGAIAQRLDYDEFGRVVLDTNPGFQPFGFGGGLYESATGLVKLGARDYDSEVGRWTTKDPILFGGKDPNLYEYVLNDPINRFDPSGLTPGEALFPEAVEWGRELVGGSCPPAWKAGAMVAAGAAILGALLWDSLTPDENMDCISTPMWVGDMPVPVPPEYNCIGGKPKRPRGDNVCRCSIRYAPPDIMAKCPGHVYSMGYPIAVCQKNAKNTAPIECRRYYGHCSYLP